MAPTTFCTLYDFGNPEQGEAGCASNVLEVLRADPNLSLAATLFERAQLTEIFSCPGSFTLLVPNNDAVSMVSPELIAFLLAPANIIELQNLMLYHVLPGYYPSSVLSTGRLQTLLRNIDVDVTVSPDAIMFNEATVIEADGMACNGVLQILDQVLTFRPPSEYLESL